jgi:hypothetical protein
MLSFVMLIISFIHNYYYAECHYAECHYAECHCDERHNAGCHYADCRGALKEREWLSVFRTG